MKLRNEHVRTVFVVLATSMMALAGCTSSASSNEDGVASEAELVNERGAILDALRPEVASSLGQPVIFQIDFLRGKENWIMLEGVPFQPGGVPIDGTKIRDRDLREWWEGSDDYVAALLKRVDGRWKVVRTKLGTTDVFDFQSFAQGTGAPREIGNDDTHALRPGSAERAQLLDALRTPVEASLHAKVKFVPRRIDTSGQFHATGNWAYSVGRYQKPDGSAFGVRDLTGTEFASTIPAATTKGFGPYYEALFHNPDGREWKLVEHEVYTVEGGVARGGADWPGKYGLPPAMFVTQPLL